MAVLYRPTVTRLFSLVSKSDTAAACAQCTGTVWSAGGWTKAQVCRLVLCESGWMQARTLGLGRSHLCSPGLSRALPKTPVISSWSVGSAPPAAVWLVHELD